MHCGCLAVTNSHFGGARKASAYFKGNTAEGGQVSFRDTIFEGIPGFVLYVDGFKGSGGQPSITMENCWNEANTTSTNVVVEENMHANPRFLFARDVMGPLIFRDTPISSIELDDAAAGLFQEVLTFDCDVAQLTDLVLGDRSTITHHHPRAYTSNNYANGFATVPGRCRSLFGPLYLTGLYVPWFRMGLPSAYRPIAAAYRLQRIGAESTIAFTGSTSRSTTTASGEGVLGGQVNAQDLVINTGETLLPTGTWTLPAGGYVVVQYVYRLLSGAGVNVSISGTSGLGGVGRLTSTTPETLVLLAENAGSAISNEALYHTPVGGSSSTVRIYGISVTAFVTRAQALEFINAGFYPQA